MNADSPAESNADCWLEETPRVSSPETCYLISANLEWHARQPHSPNRTFVVHRQPTRQTDRQNPAVVLAGKASKPYHALPINQAIEWAQLKLALVFPFRHRKFSHNNKNTITQENAKFNNKIHHRIQCNFIQQYNISANDNFFQFFDTLYIFIFIDWLRMLFKNLQY